MAITVDSSQWTGQRDDTPLAVPVVWGEFDSEAARNDAMARLRAAGARAPGDPPGPGTPAGGVTPPVRAANAAQVPLPDEHPDETSRRTLRQGAVGIAMAGSAMAAAGLVIATGGAALPAAAAAAAAGTAAGAVGEGIAAAADPGHEARQDVPQPTAEGPLIGLQAPDAETRQRADRLLREVGARRVFVQNTRAG